MQRFWDTHQPLPVLCPVAAELPVSLAWFLLLTERRLDWGVWSQRQHIRDLMADTSELITDSWAHVRETDHVDSEELFMEVLILLLLTAHCDEEVSSALISEQILQINVGFV